MKPETPTPNHPQDPVRDFATKYGLSVKVATRLLASPDFLPDYLHTKKIDSAARYLPKLYKMLEESPNGREANRLKTLIEWAEYRVVEETITQPRRWLSDDEIPF